MNRVKPNQELDAQRIEALIQKVQGLLPKLDIPASPEFAESYYLRTYPDVAQAVASGKIKSAYHHWILHGRAEGRRGRY